MIFTTIFTLNVSFCIMIKVVLVSCSLPMLLLVRYEGQMGIIFYNWPRGNDCDEECLGQALFNERPGVMNMLP